MTCSVIFHSTLRSSSIDPTDYTTDHLWRILPSIPGFHWVTAVLYICYFWALFSGCVEWCRQVLCADTSIVRRWSANV